jgi:ribosome-binding factor A
MASRRIARLNDQIRGDLAELISREMKDPRVSGLISVTGVDVAPDLSTAKVYISVLGTPEERKRALTALRSGAGFLRTQLAARLTIRRAPELHFIADTSIERGERIMELLREVESEHPAEGPAPDGTSDPKKLKPDEPLGKRADD